MNLLLNSIYFILSCFARAGLLMFFSDLAPLNTTLQARIILKICGDSQRKKDQMSLINRDPNPEAKIEF